MELKSDIEKLEDIQLLVDTFYGKVQKDVLIGPIFWGVIKDWVPHLHKMYSFWQTVLLNEHTYNGSPFPPHAQLPLEEKHFNRWLELFNETVDALFAGKTADEAKWRAEKMAAMFQHKIAFYRNSNMQPLV